MMRSFESVPGPLRVLIVDDHAAWRQQISSLVRKSGAWEVAGEAADGPDAVAMAASLRPDLILLDIELPSLDGTATAKQILAADPSSRILFLTGHRSLDVLEATLMDGARGYVIKLYAATELLPAMAAVADGRRFVSAVLGGRPMDSATGLPVPHVHAATFQPDDAALTDEYERFAAAELHAGKAVIFLGALPRREDLARRLRMRGVNLDAAIAGDRYIAMDLSEVLPPLMVNGMPDETLFWKAATSLVVRAARASRQDPPVIAAFGDAAPSLWKAGRIDAALRLEQLWDECARTFNLEILCGYVMPGLGRPDDEAYQHLCAVHSAALTR